MSRRFLLCLILSSMTCGCATMSRGSAIEHVVVIWLKEPGNADARQQLLDRSREFEKIPGVRRVLAGPVMPSDRNAVDSSFDVAVVMEFDSEKALRDYDQHPIHQKAVREVLIPLAAKFVIYDFRAR